jgi:hypothetical protein
MSIETSVETRKVIAPSDRTKSTVIMNISLKPIG